MTRVELREARATLSKVVMSIIDSLQYDQHIKGGRLHHLKELDAAMTVLWKVEQTKPSRR